jgi:hypothetical protein
MPAVNITKMTKKSLKKQRVDIDVQTYRLLPYSIVFDILNYYQSAELNAAVCACLTNTLPHRDNYENDIDLWIDLESSGDITIIQAKALAIVLSDYMQNQEDQITIALNSKNEMTRDNKTLLYYLQQFSDKAKFIFGETSLKAATLPATPPATLPDTAPDVDFLKWSCFIPIKNQDYTESVESILYHAWRCAELGADEVGFKIMEMGIKTARLFYLKQLYLVQLQFMRIASQHYAAAADEKRKVAKDFDSLYHSFNLTRAWGLILTRRVKEAQQFFALAGLNMDAFPSDLDSLYRMNIFALAQHIGGRIDNAFIIENRIEQTLAQADKPYPQMTYINSINLARLFRFAGNYEEAEKYFEKAFSIERIKKSETDLIYRNVCYGKLYENKNLWNEAMQYWLQAATHWIEAKTPEALGWRAIRAIAFQQFVPRSWLDTHIIDQAILKKLIELREKTGGQFIPQENLGSHKNLVNLVESLKTKSIKPQPAEI